MYCSYIGNVYDVCSSTGCSYVFSFFFNDTATTEIYTLSLHDALPISPPPGWSCPSSQRPSPAGSRRRDRKSTRLNSSHPSISYAVFCLKKKKQGKTRKLRTSCMLMQMGALHLV